MSHLVFAAKQQLFAVAKEAGFVDPATGAIPSSEVELSATLCLYHQLGRIDWRAVSLTTPEVQNDTPASSVITADAIVSTEFPLIATDQSQIDIWGDMPADLLFLSRDGQAVTLIESKR